MHRRVHSLFAVVLSIALASTGACNDDDDDKSSDDGADDGADDAAGDDAAGDDAAGDDGPVDNVAACNDFVDAFDCSQIDLTQFVMCDVYANTTCDVSAYFDCLADNVTCSSTGFADAGTMCASLATCG